MSNGTVTVEEKPKTQKEKLELALTDSKDLRLELGKLAVVVDDLVKGIKNLEKAKDLDAADILKVVEKVELLQSTLDLMRIAHDTCAERQETENVWKNRRIVSLLDRITIVVGGIIALISTFFAGKGLLK